MVSVTHHHLPNCAVPGRATQAIEQPPEEPACDLPGPVEQLSMSTIDTPLEAAQSPWLDTAFQLAVSNCLTSGYSFVLSSVFGTAQGNAMSMTVTPAGSGQVRFAGALNEHALQGEFSVDEASKSSTLLGRTGANEETLCFVPSDGGSSVLGKIGQVRVKLTLSGHETPRGSSYVLEGTLDDEKYYAYTELIHTNQSQVTAIETRGKLGEVDIARSYLVQPFDDGSYEIAGSGQNGASQFCQRLLLLPPGPLSSTLKAPTELVLPGPASSGAPSR